VELDLTGLVITTLRRIQDEHDYSLRGMAYKLKLSPSYLCMVYGGQRSVGISLLVAALREFPEMRQALVGALLPAKPSQGGRSQSIE